MQIAMRRASALIASLVTVAVAGVVGTAGVAGSTGDVDQEDLVGKKAPNFTLVDHEGKEHTLSDYTEKGKVVVLEWFNPGCPYVVKHYAHSSDTMDSMSKELGERDVVWLAINTGKTSGKEMNAAAHKNWSMNHPILLDADGSVGKAYGAKTTPNMYVIDADGMLRYAGAIDDNRRAKEPGERNFVREAVTAVLNGETVEVTYSKPYGCSVKY